MCRSLRTVARSSFYTSRGYHSGRDACETSVKQLYVVVVPGGTASPAVLHADCHAVLMGRDQPVSLVFTLLGTSNDIFCLPTAVGFRHMLTMRVPGEGHGSPTAGSACHALISDDSGVWLHASLTFPSFPLEQGAFSCTLSFLRPGRESSQLCIPPGKGMGLERCPAMPCRAAPWCNASSCREAATWPPLSRYGPRSRRWDPPGPKRRQIYIAKSRWWS
jgi:hypothetical protein